MQPLPRGIAPGARVVVRGRTWRLDACTAYDNCDELHLQSIDGTDNLVVLSPFDRPLAEHRPPRCRAIRSRRWLHRLRGLVAEDRAAVHLLGDAGERAILPYQLAPALAVAAGARCVLLADEVGLGKTAQAGWIIADTVARYADARVLIAVPAGIRLQWGEELSRLFAIDTTPVDAGWLLRAVDAMPAGMNVWSPPGAYVVSLDFLKRPDIAAAARGVIWDLLVVDEAHVAAAPTERYRAVDLVARRARSVVTITATPFSGDETSFASLMALGSGAGGAPPIMFRRSRAEVGDRRRRRHRFVRVRLTPPERRLQRLLERYCREVWTHAPSSDGRLAAIVLRKRALSSAAALARSLRRRERLLSMMAASAIQLTLFPEDVDEEDGEPSAVLGAPGMANTRREQGWLERLIDVADNAAAVNSKLDYVKRLLRRIPGESAVIFTEFRDTLSDLADTFPGSLRIHGGMTAGERGDVQARFNTAGGLLFATDAAANGLNLHRRCRLAINFELPWNPARLEQRIGRVDRIGQARGVHAATLVARDTAEDVVIANISRRLLRVAGTLGTSDRLAAFLNDARIAGMVIGDEPVPKLDALIAPPSSKIPDAPYAEAERLSRRSETLPAACTRRIGRDDIAVSAIRESKRLRGGFIALVQWRLREPAGRVVAARTLAMHIDECVRRPSNAAHANAVAAAFVSRHAAALRERALASLEPDRAAAHVAHRTAVESLIDREICIRGESPSLPPLQPGLFDRRAVRDAAAAEEADEEVRSESMRRIDLLRRSRDTDEEVSIRGVLIIWNHRT